MEERIWSLSERVQRWPLHSDAFFLVCSVVVASLVYPCTWQMGLLEKIVISSSFLFKERLFFLQKCYDLKLIISEL